MRWFARLRFILLISLLGMLVSCTTVAPWQRGILAQPQMAARHAPLQSARRHHLYNSREAAASAQTQSKGGACGCY